MSVDELVAYLARSSLPTLIVEGSGDKSILRRVQHELRDQEIDILPSGGKGSLDIIFSRRSEFAKCPVAFLRDQDCWVVFGVPDGNDEIILTRGYSIENDVLDRVVVDRLASPESAALHASIDAVASWFAHALSAIKAGGEVDISRDVSAIWDGAYISPCQEEMDANPIDEELRASFPEDPWIWLRGKTLLRVIQRHLSLSSPSYSKDQIVDLCIRLGPSERFSSLLTDIRGKFEGFSLAA